MILDLSNALAVRFDGKLVVPEGAVLTGSRYWKEKGAAVEIKPSTDWDYCMLFNGDNVKLLTSLGWKQKDLSSDYMDNSAVAIFANGDDSQQIVLRRSMVVYMKMLHSITPEFYANFLWKGNPKVVRDNIRLIIDQLYETTEVAMGYGVYD